MKVWIGHLVSPIRPTLCPQPSLSGQQTNTATSPTLLQHYNPRHLYSWLFEQRYNVLRLLRRPRCIIPGDSIATFGFRRSETWVTRSSAKWQINNAPDPWSQLSPKVFLSFIHQAPFPSLPPHFTVLPLLTKVAVFGPRVIQIENISFSYHSQTSGPTIHTVKRREATKLKNVITKAGQLLHRKYF